MPMPSEHSARIKDPGQYDEFRRENDKFGEGIHAIWGIKGQGEDRKSELQAIRFDAKKFSAEEAKKWLKEHNIEFISFEPASEEKSSTPQIEHRNFYMQELRFHDNGDAPKIIGYAAVFDQLSEPFFGGWRERIKPGAFKKTIQEGDIRALWNHNPDMVLGRKKNGTLKLSEDERGLKIEINPPNTQWARDAVETIRRGDIDQMSFAFNVVKEILIEGEDGKKGIRELQEVRLFEVSPVAFPAYSQTEVQVRNYPEPPQEGHSGTGIGNPPEDWQLSLKKKSLELIERGLKDERTNN